MKTNDESETAAALKALAEPRRIAILRLLQAGPRPVGEIANAVDISQQAASQHLAVLSEVGLVEARREGTRSLYAVKPNGFAPVDAFVRSFWTPRLSDLKAEVEASTAEAASADKAKHKRNKPKSKRDKS